MKNVILIDPYGTLYPLMLKIKNSINICLLYVDTDKIKEEIQKSNPNIEIFSGLDIVKWNQTWVSRDDIEKYRFIQLKCERFAGRFQVNSSYAMSQYYHGLAFWLSHFQNKKVDCVIIGAGLEHGTPADTIPMELAKSFKIPAFITEIHSANYDRFKVIKCINTGKYVNLSNFHTHKPISIDINDILCQPELCDDSHIFDVIDNADRPMIMKKSVRFIVNISASITSSIYKILRKPICKYKLKSKSLNRLYYLYSVLLSHGFFPKQNKVDVNALSMIVENPNTQIISNYNLLKKITKYYRKISVKVLDDNIKSIVWMLHYEPEATIMNRTVYNSQIYNLEMLSSCLPEGWKIYVKEHPNQFKPAYMDPSYLKQIPLFRSKYYYDKLREIKNVVLLDDRCKSSSLLDKAKHPNIVACATINGTISLECINRGVPIIMFDAESTVHGTIPGIFKIDNIDDLKEAFEKLETGNYSVESQELGKIISEFVIKETYSKGDEWRLYLPEEILLELISSSKDYITDNKI